jgi:hypothetical protein
MYWLSEDYSDRFRLKGKSRKTFYIIQSIIFLNFDRGRRDCIRGAPPRVHQPLNTLTYMIPPHTTELLILSKGKHNSYVLTVAYL